MDTNNPVLSEKSFANLRVVGPAMTLDGVVFKSGVLLLIACVTAAFSWVSCLNNPGLVLPLVFGGLLGGFVVSLILIFKKEWSPTLAPIYAVLEGAFLGGISLVFSQRYQGIAFQAAALTLGVLAVMLTLYRFRIIRATEKFKLGVFAATGAIGLLYLVSMVMGFFGKSIPFLHDASPLSIGISLIIVGVAALNLILDFDRIESAVRAGAPTYMEWYCGFGLLVTIVWLYLEILRLLSKLNDRR
jgi:uncharacterized YccA/Bax inhibitor family protein